MNRPTTSRAGFGFLEGWGDESPYYQPLFGESEVGRMSASLRRGVGYFSYLMRVWCEGGRLEWRASLEDPHTGERLNFASAGELFAYLEKIMALDGGEDLARDGQ